MTGRLKTLAATFGAAAALVATIAIEPVIRPAILTP